MTVLVVEKSEPPSANQHRAVARVAHVKPHHDLLVPTKVAVENGSAVPGQGGTGEVNEKGKLLPRDVLDQAADLVVFDGDGKKVPFRSLYWAQSGQRRRVMVIFIRHFFCGNCQEYIRTLVNDIPPASLPEGASIVVVGCGSSTLIASYQRETGCPYPIYADPTTRLHTLFAMNRTLSLGKKGPDYIRHTLMSGMMKSIWQELKRISAGDALAGGDLRQNGGEFLLEVEGSEVVRKDSKRNAGLKNVENTWAHRMTNSRDHAEIEQLRKVLELDGEVRQSRKRSERRWTSDALKRSFSNRRQSLLARAGSLSKTRSNVNDSPKGSRRRSPDQSIEAVKEELRSADNVPEV